MMADSNYPESFITNVRAAFPSEGPRYLEELPRRVARYAARWQLELDPHYPNLTYNFVAPGKNRAGREVVLKIGVPTDELKSEMEALRLFGGEGAATLIECLPKEGAFVLERICPGTTLKSSGLTLRDATEVVGDVATRLWRDPPRRDHELLYLSRWFRSLDKLYERLVAQLSNNEETPKDLVVRGKKLLQRLLETTTKEKVLHGDLHHDNILQDADGIWRAIDPKGLIGDPHFEFGPFLRNAVRESGTDAELIESFGVIAEQLAKGTSLDSGRILAWGAAEELLSHCWSVEEGGSGPSLRYASLLFTLLPARWR